MPRLQEQPALGTDGASDAGQKQTWLVGSTNISLVSRGHSPISAAMACSLLSVRLMSTTLSPCLASWEQGWENQKRERCKQIGKACFHGELEHQPLGHSTVGLPLLGCDKGFWIMSGTATLGRARGDITRVVYFFVHYVPRTIYTDPQSKRLLIRNVWAQMCA